MTALRCTVLDYIDFLPATPKVVSATEAEHVPGAREADVELLFVEDGALALEAAA